MEIQSPWEKALGLLDPCREDPPAVADLQAPTEIMACLHHAEVVMGQEVEVATPYEVAIHPGVTAQEDLRQ
jgi:hypothetical protein